MNGLTDATSMEFLQMSLEKSIGIKCREEETLAIGRIALRGKYGVDIFFYLIYNLNILAIPKTQMMK